MFWKSKKREEEQPKQVEKDVPKQVEYNFIDNLKETDFGFARLVNVRRYRGNGVSALLMINPQYMFPTASQIMGGQYTGFSPTMNRYGEGLLIVDDVSSRISNIAVEISVTNNQYGDDRYRGRGMSSEYHNYHGNRHDECLLTYDRQALANAVDIQGFVTQTKQSFLTDNKINFGFKFKSDIQVSNENELRYQVSRITNEVKSHIESQFRKEIVKSKLIESKDKFFQQLSKDVVTDIFQHIIDLIPESKLIIGNESIKFHVPINGKNTHKDLRVSFAFDDKLSNIFYELSESSKRILGYYKDSYSDISFSSDGIVMKISPIIDTAIKSEDSFIEEERYYRERYRNQNPSDYYDYYEAREAYRRERYSDIRVRNPYTDWNLQ